MAVHLWIFCNISVYLSTYKAIHPFTLIQAWAAWRLRLVSAVRFLRAWVAFSFLVSVSSTVRPPGLGLPRPNYDLIFFGHENSLFGHNRFSTLFFSMKVAESEIIVLANCILDFKDIQVWLRHFSLNLNACRVMTVFFKIPGQILKKSVITLQALWFKLKCLDQTCISLKSSMQFAR